MSENDAGKMMDKEKELLKRISEGDEEAFREVFRYYYPKVKVYIMQFIESGDDAKDLAQNVLLKVWLSRGILPEIRNFGAYLHTVTRNMAIDWCRARRTASPLEEVKEKDEVSGMGGADLPFIAKETEIQLAGRIRRMPKKRRRVFVMSRFEGRSNQEIAEELDLSKKTVESHLYLAMKELKKILGVIVVFFVKFTDMF